MTYHITREIGIDAGHRIPTHDSKCKHLHGHRYTIQATCTTDVLSDEGPQTDMVLDFGFLKDEMMQEIDHNCDHGFIFYIEDPVLLQFFKKATLDECKYRVEQKGFNRLYIPESGIKFYLVPFIPTAERLAEHWFNKLYGRVLERSDNVAVLNKITVWETPNCKASYSDVE